MHVCAMAEPFRLEDWGVSRNWCPRGAPLRFTRPPLPWSSSGSGRAASKAALRQGGREPSTAILGSAGLPGAGLNPHVSLLPSSETGYQPYRSHVAFGTGCGTTCWALSRGLLREQAERARLCHRTAVCLARHLPSMCRGLRARVPPEVRNPARPRHWLLARGSWWRRRCHQSRAQGRPAWMSRIQARTTTLRTPRLVLRSLGVPGRPKRSTRRQCPRRHRWRSARIWPVVGRVPRPASQEQVCSRPGLRSSWRTAVW